VTTIGADADLDGRSARAARTRDAVVDAYLELLEEGDAHPTARSIAARAGVSVRSVYVRFEDLDGVVVSAAERQWGRVRAISGPLPTTGSRATRLNAFVTQRCRVLELIAPVRRVAESLEHTNAALASMLADARAVARDEIARAFATEVDALPRTARVRLLDGLDVAAGTTTWEALRRHRSRSVGAARRVVAETCAALLDRVTTTDEE